MNKSFFLISLSVALFISVCADAQHLSAYSDYMDRFYIFDKGKSTLFEDLRPKSFKVGGECVLYVDSQGHLKMYHNGGIKQLEVGGVNRDNYFATDHLAAYNVYEKLKVVYKGNVVDLSSRCPVYQAQDSIIAFYDKNLESLRVFYKGEVQDIESGMLGSPIVKWKSGDNIVAYVTSRTKNFMIWYQGEQHLIMKFVEEIKFKAGRDIVAYIDPLEGSFKAFYKGEEYLLHDFPPESYKVGDACVAFVDNMGEFNYFSEGEVSTINTVSPDKYVLEDSCLAYVQDGRFRAWYNGKDIEVEAYVPSNYKLDWNTIAYLDNSNMVIIFQRGERKFLTNEIINSFEIYRDVIQLNVKVNRNITHYKGKFYEGESFYK